MLLLAGGLAWGAGRVGAAGLLGLGGAVVLGLATVLTMTVNVPMNEALALVEVPDDVDAAREIWQAYSAPWQTWNQIRTGTSGLGFLLGLWGLVRLGR